MSNISAKSGFDFWEFISCAKCHLAFATDQGVPQVPFWLTECGHVVCNNHLKADQSCTQCGAPGIQLVPLHHEMDAPMSDWFRPVPYALDGAASAAKFQQETMASLIHYYKEKIRKTMDRLRLEIEDKRALRVQIEERDHQIYELQQYLNSGEPSDTINENGKRSRTTFQRIGNNSSPRSAATPLGPNRLTLPPGQNAPAFSQDTHAQRPGSSRFVEQYAYNPPQTPGIQTAQLSHAQTASVRHSQMRQAQDHEHTLMGPPPVPSSVRTSRMQGGTFKPAPLRNTPQQQIGDTRPISHHQSQPQDQNHPPVRDRRNMKPPPTPQSRPVFSVKPPSQSRNSNLKSNPGAHTEHLSNSANNNALLFNARTNTASMSLGGLTSQRFVAPTPSNAIQRFQIGSSAPGSRAPTRASNTGTQGSQRMPFVPGAFT